MQPLHNMLSIKPTVADWDLGGCGGRLGERGWISAVYPALPLCIYTSSKPDGNHLNHIL